MVWGEGFLSSGKQRAYGPGFVLTRADYGGTLAATRSLGNRAIPVLMADATRFAPAAFSRHVIRRERCPAVRPIAPFIEWLLEFGRREPGHVLYASCDDLAWAFAEHRDDLGRSFHLWTPSFDCVRTLLDKKALYAKCAEVGLATPRTWWPQDRAEVASIGEVARFPLIVKPRTQVFLHSMRKGELVASVDDLCNEYELFLRTNTYGREMLALLPDVQRPMIQEYSPAGAIYSISGISDPKSDTFVARASWKVLQWPRRVGIGICFEDAEVDARLSSALRRLCQVTGFFGVFEAEFVAGSANEPMLIDFNPRFFGQMGFDAVRGLPSAYLVYLAATGQLSRLRKEIATAQAWRATSPLLYVHKASVLVTTMAERLAGRPPAVVNGSKAAVPNRAFDFVIDRNDWAPAVVDGVLQVTRALRRARVVLRSAAIGT